MRNTIDAAIRLLTREDLEEALTLSSTAGWNQRHEDWRMLLTLAPAGCFAAIAGGRIIGTAIGIDYGSFGWIAMMLVDPAYRGRGLGARLLGAAIDAIPADCPVRLDATPMGRPLYLSFGFEDEASLSRHVLQPPEHLDPPHERSRAVAALTGKHLRPISERDRQIFGGNRAPVLEWALEGSPQYARVEDDERNAQAYCFGRHGRLFDQIGPVVAGDHDGASALVRSAMAAAQGRAVVVDAFVTHERFIDWLRTSGFRPERPLFRMRRGPADGRSTDMRQAAGTGLQEFAIFGPEFG